MGTVKGNGSFQNWAGKSNISTGAGSGGGVDYVIHGIISTFIINGTYGYNIPLTQKQAHISFCMLTISTSSCLVGNCTLRVFVITL